VRTRNSAGLVCIVLAGAACSSPGTSQQESQQLATTSAAQSAPSGSGGPTLDLGSTDPTQVVTVSIVFKVTQPDQLEALVQATQDPSSSFYHRFLSVQDFARFYAPSNQDIARVSKYVSSFGIQVGSTLADNLVLKATGTVGAFTQAFTFQMHDFQSGSNRYHRPVSPPNVPSSLGDVMLVVAGFSSQPLFTPKSTQASTAAPMVAPQVVLPKSGTATGVAGSYTVGDFANMYDVNPLYTAGIDGTGSTIGIATLASFTPSDAYTYWSTIGLTVSQSRIRQIHIDEGGETSADAGSGETTLDVEQSGGIAPGASILVYDAPNTDGGFLDLFYSAASDNVVDSLSVSWGGPEVFYYNTVLSGGDFTSEMVAFHQAFLEGAAQGISMFAATGDSGAYDTVEDAIPCLSGPLAVDVPLIPPSRPPAARRRPSRSTPDRARPTWSCRRSRSGAGTTSRTTSSRSSAPSTRGTCTRPAAAAASASSGPPPTTSRAIPGSVAPSPDRCSRSRRPRARRRSSRCPRTSRVVTCPTSRPTPIPSRDTSSTTPMAVAGRAGGAVRASWRRR
jgi:hypothetical protein